MKTAWIDLVLGIVIGVVCTIAMLAGVNYVRGWQRVGFWQRALDERQSERLEGLMLSQIETAGKTIADGDPSDLEDRLSSSVFPALYLNYLEFARHLLENGQIDAFNTLRLNTSFAVLDLSNADLSGLDLSGVRFDRSVIEHTDFSNTNLTNASFFLANIRGSDFSNARVDGAVFGQSDLTSARLNSISGMNADFRQAILVDASLTGITKLIGARFDGAVLAQANLHASRFPEAVFDGADMTLLSAVDSDLSEARSWSLCMLNGANLGGSSIDPDTTRRLWLENAEGIDATTLLELRKRGAIVNPEELLKLVDARIIAGFEAQLQSNPDVSVEERRPLLLDLLRQYWMQ